MSNPSGGEKRKGREEGDLSPRPSQIPQGDDVGRGLIS